MCSNILGLWAKSFAKVSRGVCGMAEIAGVDANGVSMEEVDNGGVN